MAYPIFAVLAIVGIYWFIPPATESSTTVLRILGCFWTGVAIGRCLRLMYPEK